jgi:nucleotide-binding universal stress UspA family protein
MRILLYVGPAPAREETIRFSAPVIAQAGQSVTLVTGGGEGQRHLLDEAQSLLALPSDLPVTLRALDGDAAHAILSAAGELPYDLVIVGRLNQPLRRMLPGLRGRSREIAQRLEPSVLRFHGAARPIRRILLASGGDFHTFETANVTARLAAPLGASVTLLHVLSQQSLVFEGFGARRLSVEQFMTSSAVEASTLREASAQLQRRGVSATVTGRVGMVIDEILDELRDGDYDLLAIGAHRIESPLDRILLENITSDLLDLSPLPVLVAKGIHSLG